MSKVESVISHESTMPILMQEGQEYYWQLRCIQRDDDGLYVQIGYYSLLLHLSEALEARLNSLMYNRIAIFRLDNQYHIKELV
jgi:hypothetical protein